MAEEAWRRWGAEDERGALNQIGSIEVKRAVGLVTDGEVVGLAMPISATMAAPAHRPRPAHFMGRDGGDYAAGARRPGGFQCAEDTVLLPLHLGTHIDCLCHVWYDDALYNGHAGDTVRSSGALRCGAEKLGAIVTRGILLDFVAVTGAPLADGTPIGPDLLRRAFAHAGVTPAKGDAVLLRTGWAEANQGARNPDYYAEPGLDVDGALLLAEAEVAVIGADNYAIEVLPFPEGRVFPVHQRLIRDYGIPLLENLVLAPLAARGRSEFLFVASPLPIVGATASPLDPIAIL